MCRTSRSRAWSAPARPVASWRGSELKPPVVSSPVQPQAGRPGARARRTSAEGARCGRRVAAGRATAAACAGGDRAERGTARRFPHRLFADRRPARVSPAGRGRVRGCPGGRYRHIEGTRRPIDTGFAPRFQPILVKTLGRAGSTWVTHVIGAHPQALAYRPFDFEPRMLDFWMEIVRTLSHPHSYAQAVDPDVDAERGWWVGRRRWLRPAATWAPIRQSSAGWRPQSVERLAGFAQRQVDGFYESVAAAADKPDALRFVERSHEWHEIALARELYPDLRLVFLVRDMRDVLASRIAFVRKTGLAQFGLGAFDERRGIRARRDRSTGSSPSATRPGCAARRRARRAAAAACATARRGARRATSRSGSPAAGSRSRRVRAGMRAGGRGG